jgi:hypothetical protein
MIAPPLTVLIKGLVCRQPPDTLLNLVTHLIPNDCNLPDVDLNLLSDIYSRRSSLMGNFTATFRLWSERSRNLSGKSADVIDDV